MTQNMQNKNCEHATSQNINDKIRKELVGNYVDFNV